jgi:hypothetical protein
VRKIGRKLVKKEVRSYFATEGAEANFSLHRIKKSAVSEALYSIT